MALSPRSLQPLPGLCVAGLAGLAGFLVRTFIVEPESVGAACFIPPADPLLAAGCAARAAFVSVVWWGGAGIPALAVAVLTALLAWRNRGMAVSMAMLTMMLGGFGAALYRPALSCMALVCALVVLTEMRDRLPRHPAGRSRSPSVAPSARTS
ncbi:hypothetical protein IHV25_01920 [Phaeovibrio sulfidiphilus]|uniref:Uncharacterized protein n=1 Tax=Phaeovibrio sulfidiphilus TaxID=1220600 RepID=A0A8J6YHL1_9PROT|nr:hypothetical protein [Phaeovibrio sulfidiphilus]MBE1236411.1 hypothetical protein [Phaeovibrio sulfidiphilus]